MRGIFKWTFICAIIASFLLVSISAHPTPTSLAKRQDDTDVNDYHNSGKTKTSTTASPTSNPSRLPRPGDDGHGSNGNNNGSNGGNNGSSAPQIIAVGGASWYGKYENDATTCRSLVKLAMFSCCLRYRVWNFASNGSAWCNLDCAGLVFMLNGVPHGQGYVCCHGITDTRVYDLDCTSKS